MAGLDFQTGTNPVITIPADTSIDDLDPCTRVCWIYLASLGNLSFLFGSSGGYRSFWVSSDGAVHLNLDRSPDLAADTATGVVSTGQWWFIAMQYDSTGVDADQRIFIGDLNTAAAEPSYTTQTAGSGAVGSDSGNDKSLYNRGARDLELLGVTGVMGLYDDYLTSGEIETLRTAAIGDWNLTNCVGLWSPWKNSGALDLSGSGNDGSILGAPDAVAPTNTTAADQSDTQIDLSWDETPTATGYDIERDTVTIVTDHQSTSYSDTGLDPWTSYDYRVRARRTR